MTDLDAESSTACSSTSAGGGGSRKRRLSDASDTTEHYSAVIPQRKRLRRTSSLSSALLGHPLPIINPEPHLDRLPKPTRSILEEKFQALTSAPLSAGSSSSFTENGRHASPSPFVVPSSYSRPELVRSASSSSLRSNNTTNYPDMSSKYNLRDTKISIDFSVPPPPPNPVTTTTETAAESSLPASLPLTCSSKSVVYFTRGNRVHFKNMQTNEDIGQLFKLADKDGNLHLLQCGGPQNSDSLAIATTKGIIQLWDVRSKKMTVSWSTKGVGAMQFNGSVLTVGGLKGTLRFYDTRIAMSTTATSNTATAKATLKMKSDPRKLNRHQSRITALAWNEPGKLLASGDESGAVYCWDNREKVPLDVGEFVQRRKKIQHSAPVTVVNWCPWQPKLLGTGDADGILRLWDIDTSDSRSNALNPGKLELGSRINGLHFSPHCKEMITVHGAKPGSPSPPDVDSDSETASTLSLSLSAQIHNSSRGYDTSNSIVAHSFPTLRHIHTLHAANKVIGGSVMNANFTKAIVAVPEENKLKVYDVWGKLSLRRTESFMGNIR
ncbi:WD40 repeat-like protein [Lentinula edodes]|uniref:WD40 repeat-like protein n=2 Tax=Lentinula edodes TaxID=5353 RepID=A0A1Q3EHQ8_LENED|nr:WD40 repeat-like protein [Lentinula edodes]